jgi:F0F1-type ATP synthase membrane subunit b/b'
MKRLFALIVSFVLLSINVSILHSRDIQPTQIQKVYKIIRLSGLSELATLPNNDIIPVFQFALPSIPDSAWEQLRKKYDSSNIVKEMADSLHKKFTQEEIDALYDLLEPFERMKIEYESNESPISNFDLTLKYFKGLDSLWSLLDNIDWQLLDSILAKSTLLNSIFGDSTVLKFTIENTYRFIDSVEKLSKNGSKAKDTDKPTTQVRKRKPKSSVPDSLVEHSLLSIIDLWAKATQQFIEAYKNYLNALQELVKAPSQIRKDNKEFDKFLKDIEKKLQRMGQELEKESKELQKKYEGEVDKIQKEIEKEIEKLEKQMQQRENKMNEELEPLPDSSFKKYENGWDKYFQKSKELFNKYYRFFKEYRYFRKELEKRILEDLKRRGFIQE